MSHPWTGEIAGPYCRSLRRLKWGQAIPLVQASAILGVSACKQFTERKAHHPHFSQATPTTEEKHMPLKTVAILSPGDMGHDVGRALGKHGLEVITCLQGRSDRTRGLSRQAGIRDAGSLEETITAVAECIVVESSSVGREGGA